MIRKQAIGLCTANTNRKKNYSAQSFAYPALRQSRSETNILLQLQLLSSTDMPKYGNTESMYDAPSQDNTGSQSTQSIADGTLSRTMTSTFHENFAQAGNLTEYDPPGL